MQLPDWVMNKIKRHHIFFLTWVTKMKSLSQGESLNVVQKASLAFLLGSFVFVGLYPLEKEGGREGGREVLNEEARVAASCQKIK